MAAEWMEFSWRWNNGTIRHGGPLEADGYHRRILDLAALHDQSAPQNELVLAALERAAREELGPESMRADELLSG